MYSKVSDHLTTLAKNITATSGFVKKLKDEFDKNPEFHKKVMDLVKRGKQADEDVEAALTGAKAFLAILALMASIWAEGPKKLFDNNGNFNENTADKIMMQTVEQGIKDLKKKPQSEKSLRSLIDQFAKSGIINNNQADTFFSAIDDTLTQEA